MNPANSSENILHIRRRFLQSSATTVISDQLCLFSSANTETTLPKNTKEEGSMTTTSCFARRNV